jgi:hypothetical protein
MIWGKTFDEEQAEREAKKDWRPWFAWRPVQLETGRYAWLCTVSRCKKWWTRPYREMRP